MCRLTPKGRCVSVDANNAQRHRLLSLSRFFGATFSFVVAFDRSCFRVSCLSLPFVWATSCATFSLSFSFSRRPCACYQLSVTGIATGRFFPFLSSSSPVTGEKGILFCLLSLCVHPSCMSDAGGSTSKREELLDYFCPACVCVCASCDTRIPACLLVLVERHVSCRRRRPQDGSLHSFAHFQRPLPFPFCLPVPLSLLSKVVLCFSSLFLHV